MAKKSRTRRGPKPFVLKVDGDVGAILDRMLGKDGSLPPKARKRSKSKRA
jgi:hypothetical protein